MQGSDAQLEKYLFESGTLPRAALSRAIEKAKDSGDSLSDTIIDEGLLTADELRRALAHMHGTPFVRLSRENIEPSALEFIPEPFSRAHSAVAFHDGDEGLQVALLDMHDLRALDSLSLPRRILPRLTDAGSMKTALMLYQKELRQKFGDAIAREAGVVSEPASKSAADIEHAAKTPAAANLVSLLLEHALSHRASDVHLDKTAAGLLVRYRIGGRLCDAMLLPARAAASVSGRLKLLAHVPLTLDVPAEGRFKIAGEGEKALQRKPYEGQATVALSVTPSAAGERMVLHITPEHAGRDGFTLEALGFGGQQLERTHKALSQRSGLVLVCGEEGAGKTTTLYTLLDLLVNPEKNIITVEHDVECRLRGVVQTRPHKELGLTFVGAMRAALKQDPDVLMVGSIDEEDAAHLAVSAANRGVLVLASMTAASAVGGVAKLVELVPSGTAAAVLRASIGVAHVKKLCDKHEWEELSRADMNAIERVANPARVLLSLKEHGYVEQQATWKGLRFASATACGMCEGGYAGQLGLQEVLPATETLKEAMRNESDTQELETIAIQEGMLTREEDGISKAIQGRTTLDAVLSGN